MSGDAIQAWRTVVTAEMLERAQQSMPPKQRPSRRNLELVGMYLAQSFIDRRGYTEETQQQIAEGLHNVITVDGVSLAQRAMDNAGLTVVVRQGAPGHGTRRVFSFHDPKGLAQRTGADPSAMRRKRTGADPSAMRVERTGVATRTDGGTAPTHGGTAPTHGGNPRTPEQLPEENLKDSLPERAAIIARIVDAAFDMDSRQGKGELNRPSKRAERKDTYRRKAQDYLQDFPDLSGVPVWALAEYLCCDTHGNKPDVNVLNALQDWEDYEQSPPPEPTCSTCGGTGKWINPYNLHDIRPCPDCKGNE